MDTSDVGPDAFSKAFFNVQDIDANDKDNPQLVSEYVNDIYEYMRGLEVSHKQLIKSLKARTLPSWHWCIVSSLKNILNVLYMYMYSSLC